MLLSPLLRLQLHTECIFHTVQGTVPFGIHADAYSSN